MGRKIFVGVVTAIFFYISYPLLFPLAMGAVLSVLFLPWLESLERRRIPTPLGAFILTAGITLILILPMSLLSFSAVKSGLYELSQWKNSPENDSSFFDSFMNLPWVHSLMVGLTDRIPVNMSELSGAFQELSRSIGTRLTELLAGLLSHLPGASVALLVMVVSIYFFLVDGRRLVLSIKQNSIFSQRQTEILMGSVAGMCRSVILASLVSGGVQSVFESFTCILTGTPNVALIGLLVFIGSFIPVVGSLPITLFIAIQQWISFGKAAGITLTIMAFFLIAVDSAIRPWFLKGTANLHPLVAFVAALGGLQTMGFWGVFLGPIVASLFIATIQMINSEKHEITEQDS